MEAKTPLRIALNLPRRNVEFLAFAKAVLNALANNPHFPSPTPTIAAFAKDVAALDQAETTTLSRTRGTREVRDEARTKVERDLRHLAQYVLRIAETAGADAQAIVESAGFKLRKPPSFDKAPLTVKDGARSGWVVLVAKAVAKFATYYWQYSVDGGTTWTNLPETLQASASFGKLVPGTTYAFRFRALTRAGMSDYSQIVTHIVR